MVGERPGQEVEPGCSSPTMPATLLHRMKCFGQRWGPRPQHTGEMIMLALAYSYSTCMHRDSNGNTMFKIHTHVLTALIHVHCKTAECRAWREG